MSQITETPKTGVTARRFTPPPSPSRRPKLTRARMLIEAQGMATEATPTSSDATPTPSNEHGYIKGSDYIPRDSIRGIWYRFLCQLADWFNAWTSRYNDSPRVKAGRARSIAFVWEPKEPHDKLYRSFMRLVVMLSMLTRDRRRIVAVLGSKGGVGKTPLAAYLAALLTLVTNGHNLIVDSNHNEGTTGRWLDISRNRLILLLAAIRNPSSLRSSDQLREGLGQHKESGVWALLSNPNSITARVTMQEYIVLLRSLFELFDSVILDGGNGNNHPTNNAPAHLADVQLFPAVISKPTSFDIGLTTMLGYLDLGHGAKVRNGLKVVSATGRKDTREQYVQVYRKLVLNFTSHEYDPRGGDDGDRTKKNVWYNKPDELMDALGITEANMFLVPLSKHIKQERVVTLKRSAHGMPTLIAYMTILVRIFQMVAPDEEAKYVEIDKLFFPTTDANGALIQPSRQDIVETAIQQLQTIYPDNEELMAKVAIRLMT